MNFLRGMESSRDALNFLRGMESSRDAWKLILDAWILTSDAWIDSWCMNINLQCMNWLSMHDFCSFYQASDSTYQNFEYQSEFWRISKWSSILTCWLSLLWIFEIFSKILSQFLLYGEVIITLGIWTSHRGAYISCWGRNQVKCNSNLVDDECCKESERLSVENAQYEHDGICKWYSLLYSKPKTRHITFWGWTIQWSKIGVSHM